MAHTTSKSISCASSSTLLADAKAHAARISAHVDLQLGATSGGYTALNVSGPTDDVDRFIKSYG